MAARPFLTTLEEEAQKSRCHKCGNLQRDERIMITLKSSGVITAEQLLCFYTCHPTSSAASMCVAAPYTGAHFINDVPGGSYIRGMTYMVAATVVLNRKSK
eukprot:278802-Pelagomonas_calceolata.AAC.2